MGKKTGQPLFAALLCGMVLMPAFLVMPRQAGAAPAGGIIFSTTADLADLPYDLSGAELMYGGALTPTYVLRGDASLIDELSADPRIGFVQPDLPVYAADITTDDPYFPENEPNEDGQWYLDRVRVPDAWEYGTGAGHVVVAVVDTGIHADHVELNDGRVAAGYDVVTGTAIRADANSDENGHGTAVAGVIGAIPDNGKGIAGINWQVTLMPVKALRADGTGSVSYLAEAIVWAADNGADIINLSLGGPGFGANQALNNAILHAHEQGALVVAAGGNDLADHGKNLDKDPVYPVCSDGGQDLVLGVGATDIDDRKAQFSNFGISCIDVMAPGKRILTTAFLPSDPSNNILIYGSGTSLAAPIVSGVAALMKAANPFLTNDQIQEIIVGTADSIDDLNPTECLGTSCAGFLGAGRVNARSALAPQPLLDGSLARESGTGLLYLIEGGRKRLVSDFVFRQRGFGSRQVIAARSSELNEFRSGPVLMPYNGTLVKSPDDATVYAIIHELKRPVTALVFRSRGFRFSDVQTVPADDLYRMPSGEWYWPADGTLLVSDADPTVYMMIDGVKRPVTYFVFTQRGLSFRNVVRIAQGDLDHIPNAPDSYWLAPADGTLVKSDSNDTVYLIAQNSRLAVSYEVFMARQFDFSKIITMSLAELNAIQPGPELTN